MPEHGGAHWVAQPPCIDGAAGGRDHVMRGPFARRLAVRLELRIDDGREAGAALARHRIAQRSAASEALERGCTQTRARSSLLAKYS